MSAAVAAPARAVDFAWLIRLRWGSVVGQVVTILVVDRLLGIALPLALLGTLIAVEAASNVALLWWARRARTLESSRAGVVMVGDVLLLTALLYLTGGPNNPFSFLYLVQIALAAVTLPARWTWALVALSLAGSGVLFVDHRPLPIDHADHLRVHLRGMWVAFGVAAAFTVYFLLRVRRSLEAREADLAAARSLAERQERLASLATLAAGAAHELATPLSTIAVAAKELERQLLGAPAAAVDDVQLIRAQVERCRAILERMAADAGQSAGEIAREVGVRELLAASLDGLPARPVVRVDAGEAARVELPSRAVAQAIGSILKNAQDASAPDGEVLLRASLDGTALRVEITDRGGGMPPAVLARAGEPFFTTKPPGRGMGLGLFLTRAIVERLGGQLQLVSDPGRGTTATLTLPARAVPTGGMAP